MTADRDGTLPAMIHVRATINLAGLPRGAEAMVDPEDPYIAGCLKGGYLVRIPTVDRSPDQAPDVGPVDDEAETDAVVPPEDPPAAEQLPA